MTMLTAEQATDFFSTIYRGKHHIPSDVRDHSNGIFSVSEYVRGAGLSTFDFDVLTRLVLLAHERCVRLSIGPSGPGHVRIRIMQRDRASRDVTLTHPTIDEAVAKFREHDDVPWWRVLREVPSQPPSAPTPEQRWAALPLEEQWAMMNALPKIIGPWTDVTDAPGEGGIPAYERRLQSGRRMGWCNRTSDGQWVWKNGEPPVATAREAMQLSDDMQRRMKNWQGWALVGGVPVDAP